MLTKTIQPEVNVPFSQFYHLHHAWLHQLLQRKMRDWAIAEDITQETFTRLLATLHQQSLLSLQHVQNPRGLLNRMAHGIFVDNIRKNAIESQYIQAMSEQNMRTDDSPELYLAAAQTLSQMARVLDELSLPAKEAFLLYRFSNQKQEEIAKTLNIPLSTLKKHLAHVLVKCHSVLQHG